jgi:hypothetical protein
MQIPRAKSNGFGWFGQLTGQNQSVTLSGMSTAATSKGAVPARTKRRSRTVVAYSEKRRPDSVARTAPAIKPLRYDAQDIEEANRVGAALCRQHSR